jgi:hypothetical protein
VYDSYQIASFAQLMSLPRLQALSPRVIFPVLLLASVAMAAWLWAGLSERASQVEYDPGIFLLGLGLFLALLLAGMAVLMSWGAFFPHRFARSQHNGVLAWGVALWSDRVARWLMLAGLALCVALFGYLSLVYGNLPTRLALHWNSQAQVDRIGDPLELARLPVFALGVWWANAVLGWWALPRERAMTVLLLAGAVLAQVAFFAGVLSIVLRAI